MAGRKLTFKNNSTVRDVFLNTGVAEQYSVPTKTANGKTTRRSSRVEVEYGNDPSTHQWSSNSSYNNTFNSPNSHERSRVHKLTARLMTKYGSSWPEAFTIVEENRKEKDERFLEYYKQVLGLVKEIHGDLSEDELEEFIENLDAMNAVSKKFIDKKITADEYGAQAIPIFADWQMNTDLDLDLIKDTYNRFLALFIEKEKVDADFEARKLRALKNLTKSKHAANVNKIRRNKETVRKWHTMPERNENRAPGAELLALAAQHASSPKNFAAVYNGVVKRENAVNKYKFATGSEVREKLNE